MRKSQIGFICLFIGLMMGCATAAKDIKPSLSDSDKGQIWFKTSGTLVATQDGSRFAPGDPVVLSGNLKFPKGDGPFAAIILAHGCAGITLTESQWEKQLLDWGYATFLIDSFRGRNLTEVCKQPRALYGIQRIPDAYGAFRILATHPKIDGSKIALMGFSHGGILTLGASTQWAKESYAAGNGPGFRAFIAFYPYCNTTFPELMHTSAPLRIHSGEKDDWTPAEPCRQLVEKIKSSGSDAGIEVYPNAYHAFDNVAQPFFQIPTVYSHKDCFYDMDSILGPLQAEAESVSAPI